MSSLIRKDIRSIYVKTGGYLFRPVPVKWTIGYLHIPGVINKQEDSTHKAGDKVNARHRSGTSTAKVGDEIWHSHGMYGRYGKGSSENCWEPIILDDLYPNSFSRKQSFGRGLRMAQKIVVIDHANNIEKS